ncbi:hypothetical protein JST97_15660 [bacterium]|nr:hypothetical protein [bacterium]
MARLTLFLFSMLVCIALAQPRFQIGSAQLLEQSVVGGNPIQIRINLVSPAQASGQIPVTSNRPDLCQTVPMTIQTGQSQLDFIVPTHPVEKETSILISVGEYGNIRDLQVQLQPDTPPVSQLLLPPRMIGGDTGTVVVVLERPATRASKLSLQGSPNLTLPASLTVPAGVRQFEAPFSTRAVRQPTQATLSTSGARAVSAQTQLLPPVEVAGLQFTPDPIEGGQNCQVTLSLTAPAPAPARVRISAPAHLKVPAEVLVVEGSATAVFSLTSSTTRAAQKSLVEASTPAGRKSGSLTVEPTSSLFALETVQYYLMASAREGWLEVDESGQKWRVKPTGPARLGALGPFGYSASVPAQGQLQGASTPQSLTLVFQLSGSKTTWKVTGVTLKHP